MVSPGITKQILLLLWGLTWGILMMFIYDLLRIWRRVIAHGVIWIAAEDILYWCGCALGFFLLLYRQNDGLVRGFIMGAVFAGMLLYYKTVSPFVLAAGVVMLRGIVFVISRIIKAAAGPFRWAAGRFRQSAEHKKKKPEGIYKKRLKKIFKAVKMGLCKL